MTRFEHTTVTMLVSFTIHASASVENISSFGAVHQLPVEEGFKLRLPLYKEKR